MHESPILLGRDVDLPSVECQGHRACLRAAVYLQNPRREVKPTDIDAMLKHEENAIVDTRLRKGYVASTGEYRSRVICAPCWSR